MKLTYLILAHNHPEQLERMIEVLNHKNAEFIIHVDKKSDIKEFLTSKLLTFKNVVFLKKRLPVYWGGYNMVAATLNLMKAALRHNKKGYLILLSGHDFPIKPAEHIYDLLSFNYGNEYVEYFSLPSNEWSMNGGIDRIAYYWFLDKLGVDESMDLFSLQKNASKTRRYFQNFTPYGGSQWWTLTCECADYILRFINRNTLYKQYYELTFIPDEMFFHSIILNSPFKENVQNDNLRYIDWKTGPETPRILTSDDLNTLFGSDKLWARKFDINRDSLLLDQIEEKLSL